MTETYRMEYTCINCGTKHIANVTKGDKAFQGNNECPYCGMKRSWNFIHKKPQDRFSQIENHGWGKE